ncbi:MAG: hypothetical protein ACJ75Z_03330 [Solirubrobacterales bacterium]
MAIGLGRRRGRTVALEQGAQPGAPRCPADGEPLFVWVETIGYGSREDQVIDRCESCGLAVAREAVPSADEALDQLLSDAEERGERIAVRAENAASLQAWLGAENWAALRPGGRRLKPTPKAAGLLLPRRGLDVRRVRHLAGSGMASMWQTLLNLLTFHRDFAAEAVSGRLRPGTGRGLAAFWIDAVITVLAAIPTALIAVLLESGAVLARRGGVIEVQAERLPSTD